MIQSPLPDAGQAALSETWFRVVAFLLGACIGSFLNVCVSRWPANLSVVKPRSRCPRCGHEITWFENIPILSWLGLRAKCRGCGLPISVVYPLVELIVGLGWLAAVMEFGPTLTALRVAVFGTVVLGIMLTDVEHFLIPDGFTVFGFFWGLALAMVAFVVGEQGPFASVYDALIGACAGAGAIAVVGWLGEVFLKKEAMGFGDVTLMAMLGAHIGTDRALATIFLGAAVGAAVALPLVGVMWVANRVRGGERFESPHIPFGVFLGPAAVIALLWWPDLVSWYERVMGRLYG